MTQHFAEFPDSIEGMREQGLAYFRYFATEKGLAAEGLGESSLEDLLRDGYVKAEPLVYEDFLPVSAAGFFSRTRGCRTGALRRTLQSTGFRTGAGASDHR